MAAARPIPLLDLTWLKKKDISSINWQDPIELEKVSENILNNPQSNLVPFGIERMNIKEWSGLSRFDFQREKRKAEKLDQNFRCGMPDGDRRHARKKTLGEANGEFIGFLDDNTPCRIKKDNQRVPWFRLNNQFMDVRKTRCFSGPPDKYAYAAGNENITKKVFYWFALGRTFASNGYPMWVDADELWPMSVSRQLEKTITKICFAIGFADNECVETVFPANNPIKDAKEIYIGNPMTPIDNTSFWSEHMSQYFLVNSKTMDDKLVDSVNRLFSLWKEEFRNKKEIYVDYDRPYFVDNTALTQYAGIVQIKDYAKETSHFELLTIWSEIQTNLKKVKHEFNEMLHDEGKLNYFSISKIDNVVPFKTTVSKIAIQNRAALASYIVNELHDEKTFGRIKFAKLFYLLDSVVDKDLETRYYRQAAGPLDPYSLYNEKSGIEKTASEINYFHTHSEKEGKLQKVNYVPGECITDGVKYAEKVFKKQLPKIQNILKLLKPLNTERCEIVATLYACWNDMIIEGREISDKAIVDEFLNQWHKEKERFTRDRLLRAIPWMREKGIVPIGHGPKTIPQEPPNQEDLFK